MRKKIFLSLFAAAVALMSVFSFLSFSESERRKRDELYKQLELFSDAMNLVKDQHVDAPNDKDLIYGALKGMLSSLDPYSEFLDPERYNELKVDTEGRFGGLGIEIAIKDNMITVITPMEDTPAWRAGLKPGDRIVKINGELIRNVTSSDAVKKLRGKPGTEVTLTILREGQEKLFEVKIVRDIIKTKDIKNARILEDNIGYVRLVEFRENTPSDLDMVLLQLKKSGMDSLILDLRNNPGGLLDVAVNVAERFIPAGKPVVSTKGRMPSQEMELKSSSLSARYLDIPLVILVNEGSASASEIVAGALQDHKRAVVVGGKTFGKGSVQSVLPLFDGSALKLTTSKFFTPSGRMIHNQGILPDVSVNGGRPGPVQAESALESVLTQLNEKEQPKIKEQPAGKEEAFDYKNDNQIVRSIDIIKGIKVYKSSS